MKEVLHKLRKSDTGENEGQVSWESPSNIAVIKYWGKFGKQLPANPSLSFTLSNCVSKTTVSYRSKSSEKAISLEFNFDGKIQEAFGQRIEKFLTSILTLFPLLNTHHLIISSENSFPHSSGIASSASAMSALALCLVDIQNQLAKKPLNEDDSRLLASYIARIGSGSASRSIYGNFTVWGKTKYIKGSSDLYAIPYPYEIHDDFLNLHDDILIVEKSQKSISSSEGHNLMIDHPFAKKRFEQAARRFQSLKSIMKGGEMNEFGELLEQEALSLHAMMMTSKPYFILFKPNTLSIVNEVWRFRKSENIPIFFTLDAGANVHLVYRDNDAEKCRAFIENQLLGYCENRQYICDRIGNGPKRF